MASIAIVIPVYNSEKFVKKCINSIRKQSFQSWKLILVDDGSTDDSGSILDYEATNDDRITVIHQENKGSVEARKTGVLSEEAKNSTYIMLCDSDDILPKDAVEKLFDAAQKYGADIVCGMMQKMTKGGMLLPNRGISPCFQIDEPAEYTHDEIIDKLLISYFGYTNFPVNLCAKLYKTDLLSKVIDFMPVVRFMGDDLSVSVRAITESEKLVIIPDVVYHYRSGGGTSKFMPYMMDDFINLYQYKREFALKYPMPQDWQYLMDVELLNVLKTHIQQCIKFGRFDREHLIKEANKICDTDVIHSAAENVQKRDSRFHDFSICVFEKYSDKIVDEMITTVNNNKMRDRIVSLLRRI